MTLNRLLITSVVIENRPVREVAAQYGVSESWLFELLARYKAEGEAALLRERPDAVILRPSLMFGPGDGSFSRFATLARMLPVLPLPGAESLATPLAGLLGATVAPPEFRRFPDGESYDARREMPGWAEPGFDDSGWYGVAVEEIGDTNLVAQPDEVYAPSRPTAPPSPSSSSRRSSGPGPT